MLIPLENPEADIQSNIFQTTFMMTKKWHQSIEFQVLSSAEFLIITTTADKKRKKVYRIFFFYFLLPFIKVKPFE